MECLKHFLDGLKSGFKEFGENISNLINLALLAFVYFIGVGATSLLAKLMNKRFLELKPCKKTKSYWQELDLKTEEIDSYYRQF